MVVFFSVGQKNKEQINKLKESIEIYLKAHLADYFQFIIIGRLIKEEIGISE